MDIVKALSALSSQDEQTKSVITGLVNLLSSDGGKIAELASAIGQIASLKDVPVEELLSSGALGRFLTEKLLSGVAQPEKSQKVMAQMACPHCDGPIFTIQRTHVPQEIQHAGSNPEVQSQL